MKVEHLELIKLLVQIYKDYLEELYKWNKDKKPWQEDAQPNFHSFMMFIYNDVIPNYKPDGVKKEPYKFKDKYL